MKNLFLILSLFMTCTASFAFKGYVYEKGSDRKKILYTIEREEIKNDNKESLKISYMDPKGILAVKEIALFEDNVLTKYSVDFPRRKEKGSVTVQDKKLLFKYTKEGETDDDDEKLTDNFIVGLSMTKNKEKNWQKVVDGETLKTRFGVPKRKETVGFSYFRVKDKEIDKKVMVVKMKPSSFIISTLVDPLYFSFNLETKKLISFVGRTKPKQLVKGKWKDLDAETVYKWEE